jgi:signal peptidase I
MTLVHTYVMQPLLLSALKKKTLLIGDFLFCKQFHYGARTNIVAAPMVHDTLPLLNVKSYLPNHSILILDSWF